jgi:hypothetical protein
MKIPSFQEVQVRHATRKAFVFKTELDMFAKFISNKLFESRPNKDGEFSLYYQISINNVKEIRDQKDDFLNEVRKLFCKAGWNILILNMIHTHIDIKIKAKSACNSDHLDLSS